MKITMRYFALWREELGHEEETREVAPGTTVAALIDGIVAGHPRLAALRRSTMFMLNQEYVEPGQALSEGDEVAVIPPVSGGSGATDGRLFKVVEAPLDVNEVIRAVADPAAGVLVACRADEGHHGAGAGIRHGVNQPVEHERRVGDLVHRRRFSTASIHAARSSTRTASRNAGRRTRASRPP